MIAAPRHRLDGPDGAPVVVLGPSLGTSMDLWLPQLPALTRAWRVMTSRPGVAVPRGRLPREVVAGEAQDEAG
ncbi:hypothetical protein AB0K37_40460, partial [Actinomadura sp. NPDC049753]